MSNGTISFVVDVDHPIADRKALFGTTDSAKVDLAVDTLRDNLKIEVDKLLIVLGDLPKPAEWHLDKVDVGLTISAEGGVSFIASGKVSGSASLTLTFSKGS